MCPQKRNVKKEPVVQKKPNVKNEPNVKKEPNVIRPNARTVNSIWNTAEKIRKFGVDWYKKFMVAYEKSKKESTNESTLIALKHLRKSIEHFKLSYKVIITHC